MNANSRLSNWIAVLIVSILITGCGATTQAPEARSVVDGKPARDISLLSDIWITYSPSGLVSSRAPNSRGLETVSVGDLRAPIFSVRLSFWKEDGSIEADLATPGGFDSRHLSAADISDSDASRGEEELERALKHHRPILRLSIGADGDTKVRRSPAFARHEICARQLLRTAAEARIATAENEDRRRFLKKRLQNDFLKPVSVPVEHASRLVQLAMLSLPAAPDAHDGAVEQLAAAGPLVRQSDWRALQIRNHGRPVRLQLDLLRSGDSPAARLCRSLRVREISELRNDTCTIEGVIDRRDGWPLTLLIARKGESATGAKESESRTFHRVAPLQGFVPPANPCAAQ